MRQAGLPASRQDLLVRLVSWCGLLLVFAWNYHAPPWLVRDLWYLPVVVLAHFQSSQVIAWRTTVVAIFAVWLGWQVSPSQRGGDALAAMLLDSAAATAALLALYLACRHQALLYQRDRELRRARQRDFETLAESLPIQIWTATPAGVIDFVGRQFASLTGRPRAELLADWPSSVHPEDREATLARWQHSVATGAPYECECRLRTTDGRYAWHLARAMPERDAGGNIVRWLGSTLDIDHIQRLRAEAQDLATRMRNKLESINDAFFALDWEFRFTFVNAKAASVLGHACEELLGKRLWADGAGDDASPFVVHCRRAMAEQSAVHVQEWFAPQSLWLDIRIYPSRGGLTVYFLDITRQREEQKELLLLRTAVSRINDVIMITEADAIDAGGPRILFINEAFERITGYTQAEVVGRSPQFLHGPDTQQEAIDRIIDAVVKREPVRVQMINYTKAGTPFCADLDIVPITDESGRYTHFVSIERDITEHKQLARQLQVAQRMEAVGHLTGGIAHDFNNLLTVVLGNAEMLAEQLEHDPDLVPLARMIVQAADRGASLVRSLLAFARRQSLSPEPVAIDELVRELVPILETSLTRQHRLELQIQAPLWTAMVDPGQLESTLLNLVINARDAMQGNGRLVLALDNATLDEAYAREHADVIPGQYVRVAVSDTGSGIAPEHLDRVFEPFFSTKDAGKGSGLGLSTAFGFITQSGGHITVASEPEKGSTFRLYLPRTERMTKEQTSASAPGVTRAAGREILIVEDDDGIRHLAAQYLERAGYRTQAVVNGDAALVLLEQGCTPALLLTDVVMPGVLSGPALARAARARCPGLPILFASGFADEVHQLESELGEGADFLAKPYRRDQLLTHVAALLGRAAS
ncbi:MAG: putative sensor histidine kinase with a response regulator receiver domain [Moraxellaceae bacterium]|jgi:PAS domain S-box-containing protein|nr:putative sensor histidine kinase with a response regulator receiver domain [Moraxellaceae bacterium]